MWLRMQRDSVYPSLCCYFYMVSIYLILSLYQCQYGLRNLTSLATKNYLKSRKEEGKIWCGQTFLKLDTKEFFQKVKP